MISDLKIDLNEKKNCNLGNVSVESDINQKMRQDKLERDTGHKEQLLLELEKAKWKLKKRKKKIFKLHRKLHDYDEELKKLHSKIDDLQEKNKKLGWMLLQKQSQLGEKLPEMTLTGKSMGNIECLLDADVTDLIV